MRNYKTCVCLIAAVLVFLLVMLWVKNMNKPCSYMEYYMEPFSNPPSGYFADEYKEMAGAIAHAVAPQQAAGNFYKAVKPPMRTFNINV